MKLRLKILVIGENMVINIMLFRLLISLGKNVFKLLIWIILISRNHIGRRNSLNC
jgi:hypothetical protein